MSAAYEGNIVFTWQPPAAVVVRPPFGGQINAARPPFETQSRDRNSLTRRAGPGTGEAGQTGSAGRQSRTPLNARGRGRDRRADHRASPRRPMDLARLSHLQPE